MGDYEVTSSQEAEEEAEACNLEARLDVVKLTLYCPAEHRVVTAWIPLDASEESVRRYLRPLPSAGEEGEGGNQTQPWTLTWTGRRHRHGDDEIRWYCDGCG